MTASDLTTLFLCLHLIACDRPATDCEAAWLLCEDRWQTAWAAGVWLGLVGPAERPWADIRPFRPVGDQRHDLDTLRRRAHPLPVPAKMAG